MSDRPAVRSTRWARHPRITPGRRARVLGCADHAFVWRRARGARRSSGPSFSKSARRAVTSGCSGADTSEGVSRPRTKSRFAVMDARTFLLFFSCYMLRRVMLPGLQPPMASSSRSSLVCSGATSVMPRRIPYQQRPSREQTPTTSSRTRNCFRAASAVSTLPVRAFVAPCESAGGKAAPRESWPDGNSE